MREKIDPSERGNLRKWEKVGLKMPRTRAVPDTTKNFPRRRIPEACNTKKSTLEKEEEKPKKKPTAGPPE